MLKRLLRHNSYVHGMVALDSGFGRHEEGFDWQAGDSIRIEYERGTDRLIVTRTGRAQNA